MNIKVGMKCRQINVIEEYGFDFVGMEFEITKVTNAVIMGKNGSVGFGIDTQEFENYFELIEEEKGFTQEELALIYDCLEEKADECKVLLDKIEGMFE